MSFWNISPAYAQGFFRAKEAYYNAMNWPFGYSLNFLGDTYYGNFELGQVDYNTAFNVNMLLHNPFYVPYIPTNVGGGMNDIDYSQINLAADKTILQCKFASLGANLNDLLGNINSALASKDLTDGQRTELEKLKAQTEDLLKRREDFAKKSPDMEIADAAAQMEALYGEFYDLSGDFDNLVNKIRSGEDVTPPEAQKTPEQIAQEYENTTKPAIQELLDNPDVSEEDKQALRDLQERLEKAIQDGASQEELNEIYDELQNKINGIQSNLPQEQVEQDDEDETPIEEMSVADIKDKLKNEIKPEIRNLQNDKYLDDEDKRELRDKQKELQDAIRNGASEDEIRALYKELKDMITVAKVKSEVGKTIDPDLDGSYLTNEDKEELQTKVEELENALAEGAPDEEIQERLEEIAEMIEDAKDEINAAKSRENSEYAKAKEKLDKEYQQLKEDIKNSKIGEGNELSGYLSDKDKKDLSDLMAKYDKAVQDKKPVTELESIINEIKEKQKALEDKAQSNHDSSFEIADNIYNAAIGWDTRLIGTGEKEQIIIDNVKAITKDNVIYVLRAWNEKALSRTNKRGRNDICILETISEEFMASSKKQQMLINHILDAVEGYAKENGLYDKAKPYLTTIRGQFKSWYRLGNKKGAYKDFRDMLKEVFDIPSEEDEHKKINDR